MINLIYYVMGGMHNLFKFKVGNVVVIKMAHSNEFSMGWRIKKCILQKGKPDYRIEREFDTSSDIRSACYEQIREEHLILFSEF